MITGRKRRSLFSATAGMALVGLLMGVTTACGAAAGGADDEAELHENGATDEAVAKEEHTEVAGAVLPSTTAAAIPQGGNNPTPCTGPCGEPQPSPWRPTNPNATALTAASPAASPGESPEPSPWTPPGVPSPNTNGNKGTTSPNENLASQ